MSAKNSYITLRVHKDTHTAFMQKANMYGKPSEVLREIIEGFLGDRLVIKPDPSKESLYVNRTTN
jgi:hypothetical protein